MTVLTIYKYSQWVRLRMPIKLFKLIRRLGNAVLTPILWSLASGHFRSALLDRPVDQSGHPIPWYTFPCVQFLGTKDFAGKTVAEFGAGYSTLWWAARCKSLVSFEDNETWY